MNKMSHGKKWRNALNMNWIDRIAELKKNNESCLYNSIDKNTDSYYEPHDNKKYIEEYYFSTVMELRDKFAQLWNEDGFMINYVNECAMTAFSMMPNTEVDEINDNDLWNVSEFIYTL